MHKPTAGATLLTEGNAWGDDDDIDIDTEAINTEE